MFSTFKMAVCLIGLLCLTSSSFAQRFDQGVGLRVGDPFGISYKQYRNNRTALEFTLGTTSPNRHGAYYKDKFKSIGDFDGFRYTDHTLDFTLAAQGRYLLHYSFPANVEGRLDWYWGVGAQVRLSTLEYTYFNASESLTTDERTNFDLGLEGIIGMEYELQDFPIVGFGEFSLFGELADQPLKFRLFAAMGVRYAF
ncbi:MAG: hypothetical protein AAF731_09310 [Bacteroidota bacterium]